MDHELQPNEIHFVRGTVQARVATALRQASQHLWSSRGGVQFLELDEVMELCAIVQQAEQLAEKLERKLRS